MSLSNYINKSKAVNPKTIRLCLLCPILAIWCYWSTVTARAQTDQPQQAAIPIPENKVSDKAAIDKTDTNLDSWRTNKGLKELKTQRIGAEITMRLHITRDALAIIESRNFDLKDDQFILEDFTQGIADIMVDSVNYFGSVVTDSPVRDFHLIIDDFGADRKSTSAQALRNTRILRIDLRRWHKMYHGKNSVDAWGSSIHEFTHIVNYVVDGQENQYHRELVAILFEAMNFVRRQGVDQFKNSYLRIAPIASADAVSGSNYTGNAPLRHLAHAFIRKVMDGTYQIVSSDPKISKGASIERFAASYLKNPRVGDEGFNNSLLECLFKDATGAPLTLETIRKDLHAELTQ